MKLWLLLVLLLLVPFSSAYIEIISELEDRYSLGDEIEFSIKIIPDTNADALIKMTLTCTNKKIPYYVSPVYLEEGKEIEIEAPLIKAFSEGLCDIGVNIESLEGKDIDGISSEKFSVSDRLELSFIVDKTNVLPGEEIKIEGVATKSGETIEDGIVVVKLDGKEEEISLNGKKFSYDLKLDEDIKSGEHTIMIEVSDSYGNFEEEGVSIDVEAVPTSLEFNLNKEEFKPLEELELTVLLLDQAGDDIDGGVDVRLFNDGGLLKGDIVLFDTLIEANNEFSFTFNYSTLPYDYILKGDFGEFEEEQVITILPYKKIEMNIDGSTVSIKNVGNVEYDDETIIILDKDGKTYIINKKIKLDVGEETTIALSKEVGSGTYTVTLPEDSSGEVVEKTVEKVVEKEVTTYSGTDEEEKEVNVIKNVRIEDERSAYKKGIEAITGRFIAGAGVLLSRPKFGSFIIIIIILAIIAYFNRKRIVVIIEKIRKNREEKY